MILAALLAMAAPAAVHSVDLTTPAGMAAFSARWRNRDAEIVQVPAMARAQPKWKLTYDLQPKAGAAGFDDSGWPEIEPQGLLERRGGGNLYMTWFRTRLTMPATAEGIATAGSRATLVFTVDDYAEVWVNGALPAIVGKDNAATIQGYNKPTRVVLSEAVKPGATFDIAILAINGPISVSPANPVFFREARIEFSR